MAVTQRITGIALLALVSVAVPVHAGVYKWVDDEGNVHYSDRAPAEGAKEIDLPETSRYSPPTLGRGLTESSGSGIGVASGGGAFGGFSVEAPRQDETIRSDEGIVPVTLGVPSALKPGDSFELVLDGATLPGRFTASSFQLSGVERGRHVITARLRNADGGVVAETGPVTFFLRQTNLADKARADELDRNRLFDEQQQRQDAIEAERRAQEEIQRRDQAEQDAKVDALSRQGDFVSGPTVTPVLRPQDGFAGSNPDSRRFSREAPKQYSPRDRSSQRDSLKQPDPIKRETATAQNPPPGSGSIKSIRNNPSYAPAPPGGISPAFRPPSGN